MRLRELALTLGVKRKDTCKLFFGIYPYSLVTPVPQDLIDEKAAAIANYNRIIERRRALAGPFLKKGLFPPKLPRIEPSMRKIRLAYQEGVDDVIANFLATNAPLFGADDYYYAFNRSNITFYVLYESTAIALLKQNVGVFTSITEPYDADAARFLKSCANKRLVVRERLFDDEYNYRIDFKWQADQNYATLDERVERMIFRKKSYSYGIYRKLYLKDDDDLVLARLGLDDCIESITKCVLRTEIPPS